MLQPATLARVLEAKLRHELAAVRGGDAGPLPPSPWAGTVPIGPGGLGCDSLELMWLAGAVNEMFHIHETGIEDYLLARRRFGDWVELVGQSWGRRPERLSFPALAPIGAEATTTREGRRDLRRTYPVAALGAVADALAAHLPGRLRTVALLAPVTPAGFVATVLLPARLGVPTVPGTAGMELLPDDLIVADAADWAGLRSRSAALPDTVAVLLVTGPAAAPVPPTDAVRPVELVTDAEGGPVGWRQAGTDRIHRFADTQTSPTHTAEAA